MSAELIGSYLWAKAGFRFGGNEDQQREALEQLWADRCRLIGQGAVEKGLIPPETLASIDNEFPDMSAGKRSPSNPVSFPPSAGLR